MKKLTLAAALALVVALTVTVFANAVSNFGTEYSFAGVGPAYSGYGPGPHVRSVIIHGESQNTMDVFKVNGVSYKSTCRWLPTVSNYHCLTPLMAPTYPMYIETGTGAFWWIDITEYYTRWVMGLPELHGLNHSTPRPGGPTNTPLPTDNLPFSYSTPTPEWVDHPWSENGSSVIVLTVTPEVP